MRSKIQLFRDFCISLFFSDTINSVSYNCFSICVFSSLTFCIKTLSYCSFKFQSRFSLSFSSLRLVTASCISLSCFWLMLFAGPMTFAVYKSTSSFCYSTNTFSVSSIFLIWISCICRLRSASSLSLLLSWLFASRILASAFKFSSW